MKKLLKSLALLLIFLPGCARQSQPIKYTYPLARLENFTEDDSLYTENRLIEYPSPVDKEGKAYRKKDLANLDYNKEVRFKDIYFRIPDKCGIFKKDKTYYIDFPMDEDYNILISFEAMEKSGDLIDLANKLSEDYKDELISKPVVNKLDSLESVYFIRKDSSYTYTHFFLRSENSTIHFVIKEDSFKNAPNIMADILMTAYTPGDDPIEVSKSFADYKNSLSVFVSRDVEVSGLKLKIPENFYLNQDRDTFKSFIAKDMGEVVGEIIIKEDKLNGDIYEAYGLNTGSVIYPARLVNMGPVKKEKDLLEGDVRLYLKESTLTGRKFVIKTKDSYITIIILGPLANQSLSKSMAKSIKDSISY